jgi:hypothetical protein
MECITIPPVLEKVLYTCSLLHDGRESVSLVTTGSQSFDFLAAYKGGRGYLVCLSEPAAGLQA